MKPGKLLLSKFKIIFILILSYTSYVNAVSNDTVNNQRSDNLELKIFIGGTEFIKGQKIDAVIRIRNISDQEINVYLKNWQLVLINNIYSTNKVSPFASLYSMNSITIKPNEDFFMALDVNYLFDFHNMIVNHPDYLWMIIEEGNYSIYLRDNNRTNPTVSNKKNFVVHSVPDSLEEAYLHLSSEGIKRDSITGLFNTELHRFNKYKHTEYQREYYSRAIQNYFLEVVTHKKTSLKQKEYAKMTIQEFILKYPNSHKAMHFYEELVYRIERGIERVFLIDIYNEIKLIDKNKMPFKKNLFIERFKKYRKVGIETYLKE